MAKIISVSLPHDLPQNWNDSHYVSPGGTEVGLTPQHGYNYLMQMVNAVQQAAIELETHLLSLPGSKNLLHNWYLRSPINTKAGYIIPTGTSYYGSESLTTKVGTTPYIIVPNYVGSTYASYVLSGTTFYVSRTSLVYGYLGSVDGSVCIDRWRLKNNSTLVQSSIEPQSSACKIVLAKQNGDFYQEVTKSILGSTFRSLMYTFSAQVESVTDGTMYLYITDGKSTKQVWMQSAGLHSVSLQVAEGATKLVVGIKNTSASNAGTIKVSAVKLEVGAVSTLASDPPADRAEQMAICVQFDPNTDEYRGFTSLTTANILADATITE